MRGLLGVVSNLFCVFVFVCLFFVFVFVCMFCVFVFVCLFCVFVFVCLFCVFVFVCMFCVIFCLRCLLFQVRMTHVTHAGPHTSAKLPS